MKRIPIATLAIIATLPFASGPAWADMAEWEDSGKYGGDDGNEGDESGDGSDGEAGDDGSGESGDDEEQYEAPNHGEPDAEDTQDEGCMAAAVNPTTTLSLGLGLALMLGLRRSDHSV